MCEIMKKLVESIEWTVVVVSMLACVGCILVIIAFVTAIVYENAWLLLILFPACACISLSIGIYDGGC